MAAEVEIIQVSTKTLTDGMLPVKDAVIGTTTHTGLDYSLAATLKRDVCYKLTTVGSTYVLSTAAYLTHMYVIPFSTAAGLVALLDGSTGLMSLNGTVGANASPYDVPLNIRNTSTVGFKVTVGASNAVVVFGAFAGAPTTA